MIVIISIDPTATFITFLTFLSQTPLFLSLQVISPNQFYSADKKTLTLKLGKVLDLDLMQQEISMVLMRPIVSTRLVKLPQN